jgi:hypothetical protein
MNLPEESSRGLVRFSEDAEDEIDSFVENARKLGLGNVVRRIDDKRARDLCGPLYREGTVCVEVPDAPFDEAGLLLTARARARAQGARFIEVDKPVELRLEGGHSKRWQLVIGGECFRAPRLVLAAGIGNLKLLGELGVEHDLEVRRTPLLVIPSTEEVRAPILVDRSIKLAVARHGRTARPPLGCLVAGVSVGTPVPISSLMDRQIPSGEWGKIYSVLPRTLQPDQSRGHRFTCGYEVMRGGANRVRKEDLIVEKVDGFEDIVLALPGRATLSYRAAELVLQELDLSLSESIKKAPSTEFQCASNWSGSIDMHHQKVYDTMDERVKEET